LHGALRGAQDFGRVDVSLDELSGGFGKSERSVESDFGTSGFAVNSREPVGAIVEEGD
jgi:hypothetical protein